MAPSQVVLSLKLQPRWRRCGFGRCIDAVPIRRPHNMVFSSVSQQCHQSETKRCVSCRLWAGRTKMSQKNVVVTVLRPSAIKEIDAQPNKNKAESVVPVIKVKRGGNPFSFLLHQKEDLLDVVILWSQTRRDLHTRFPESLAWGNQDLYYSRMHLTAWLDGDWFKFSVLANRIWSICRGSQPKVDHLGWRTDIWLLPSPIVEQTVSQIFASTPRSHACLWTRFSYDHCL